MTTGAPPGEPRTGSLPARDLDVPRSPVREPRGGGRAGIVALVALVAVIAVAVGIAQLAPAASPAPGGTTPVPPASADATLAAVPPLATDAVPDPSTILAATPPRLSRDALRAAVLDGSLDGRLVFVDGEVRATHVPCAGPLPGADGCVDLAIPGIGVPVSQGVVAIPWTRSPPHGSWLVTVARGDGLVYLGSLVPWENGPRTLAGIQPWRDAGGGVFKGGTLLEADGWLVVSPVRACPEGDTAATPCPPPAPFLATDEPMPDGVLVSDGGQQVDLAAPVPGLDPGAVVTGGTFLVATVPSTDRAWRVVAHYVPARSVRVLVP